MYRLLFLLQTHSKPNN